MEIKEDVTGKGRMMVKMGCAVLWKNAKRTAMG